METLPPAGKPILRDHGAQHCLTTSSNTPRTPEHLKRFSQRRNPDVGQRRSLYTVDETLQHGKKTNQSMNASELLNPQPLTLFQSKLTELSESIYSSRANGPLGQRPYSDSIPTTIDPLKQTFGKKTVKGDPALMLVSPPKTRAEVEEESLIGKDLYRMSHNNYNVGEMIDRNYNWDTFSKDTKFGVPTPHDNSGKEVNLAMNWHKGVPVISKQLDDFRERNQPQLGRVHDPIADTLRVSPDHTFGVLVQPDDCDAGKLLHTSGSSMYLQCNRFDSGLLASIRSHVKRQGYSDFDYLLNGFKKLAANNDMSLEKATVQKILFEYGVPLEVEMIELLLTWCKNGSDERVDYELLVQLINWKLDLDLSQVKTTISNNNCTQETCKHDKIIKQHIYKRTSQQIHAVAGKIPTTDYRTFGTPTIRADRPPPRIKRVADGTNYGDESDSYGLMYPSVYSSFGVYEQDFFIPRSSEQIRSIFSNIGVTMTDTQFKTFWEKAASMDKNGQVSVESFRQVLEEIQIKTQ